MAHTSKYGKPTYFSTHLLSMEWSFIQMSSTFKPLLVLEYLLDQCKVDCCFRIVRLEIYWTRHLKG